MYQIKNYKSVIISASSVRILLSELYCSSGQHTLASEPLFKVIKNSEESYQNQVHTMATVQLANVLVSFEENWYSFLSK